MSDEQVQTITPAQLEEMRGKSKRIIEKARANIVLDHPFFASIMLKRPFIETLEVPTLAVANNGTIYYNPAFMAERSLQETIFAVCHEILHYASGHGIRVGTRDPKKWNIAGDMWINDTLKKSGFTLIPGVIDVPGSAERTVEDIYASFPPDDPNGGKGQGKGQGNGGGQGNNDPMGDDIMDDPAGKDPAQAAADDADRKMAVAEAAQVAKMRGKLPGVLQKFASDTIETRTPWYDILERYMTDRVAIDNSWARPNRRYAPDFYMPTRDSEGSMGEVVIQVDISGSVSPQEIKHYNGHMKRIVEQCRPAKVHVIYTDTEVQRHETFEKPEDMVIEYYSGGGTDMTAGLDFIKKEGIEPAVFVTLTDGYTPWPDAEPDVPTVWCISTTMESPVGTNVHFDLND